MIAIAVIVLMLLAALIAVFRAKLLDVGHDLGLVLLSCILWVPAVLLIVFGSPPGCAA